MNVNAELQSAVLSISGMETPAALALEVAAPLVECAVKILVSILDCWRTFFSQ